MKKHALTKQNQQTGISNFVSYITEQKIYGRLDFLSPLTQPNQSKRYKASQLSDSSDVNHARKLNKSVAVERSSNRELPNEIPLGQSISIRPSAKTELKTNSRSFTNA
jgi:hypothetical protein